MKFSLGLPVERAELFEELSSGPALAELAQAAESAGFDAVSVTDHPFPEERWLRRGGHHTYEPLVALSYVAAVTTTVRLHTNVYVLGYRNPFLAAKGISSLDALSGGRVILGVAAGYLEREFEVLGADFARRNDVLDESIAAVRAAWTGEPVSFAGEFVHAEGHRMVPAPLQRPGPPIWVGGNSIRAIRRAVQLADGWQPFPQPAGAEKVTRTPTISSIDDLRVRIERARELAGEGGRTEPLDICFVPFGLTMFDPPPPDFAAVSEQVPDLGEIGVTWLSIQLRGDTRAAMRRQIDTFADQVISVA